VPLLEFLFLPVVEGEAVHVSSDGVQLVEHIAVFDDALGLTKAIRGQEVERAEVQREHLLGGLLVGFVQGVLNVVCLLHHVDKTTILLVGLFDSREFKGQVPVGDVLLNLVGVALLVLRLLEEELSGLLVPLALAPVGHGGVEVHGIVLVLEPLQQLGNYEPI